jgi:hypothetical protein
MSDSPSFASVAQSVAESGGTTNTTDIWGPYPASDPRNSATKSAIEDSLLGDDNIVGDHRDSNWFESVENGFENDEPMDYETQEPVAEAEPEEAEYDLEQLEPVTSEELQELQPEQQSAQEMREPTASEVTAGLEQLNQDVERLGLNDEGAAQQLAYQLSAPFGTSPETVDTKALGSTLSKMALSAAEEWDRIGGDFQALRPISTQAAQVFTSDFLGSFGVDARLSQVDPVQFTRLMFGGALNFISAVNQHGLNAPMERLNDPQTAEWFVSELNKCFGINQPVDRQTALHIVDASGRYMLGVLQKLVSQHGGRQQSDARPSRARTSQRRSRFQTNQDLFDDEGEELYRRERGRL